MSDGRHGMDGDEDTVEGLRAQRDQLAAELVAALAQLDRIGAAAGFPITADGTGPLPAVQRQPASHRVPKEQRWLRLVPGLIPVLGALRWAWHAHRAATTVAGAVVTLAATTTTAVVSTQPAHSTHRHGAASAPAGINWDARPIPSPSAVARAAGRAGLDAKSSRKSRPVLVVPVPSPTVSSPPATPATSPPYSPPYSPPAPPPPLSLSVHQLDLGVFMVSQPGALTISNPQEQAASWSVDCGPDAVVLPAQGVLEPGQQDVPLTVRINPIDGLDGTLCTFSPGGKKLAVTWAGAGSPSSAAG